MLNSNEFSSRLAFVIKHYDLTAALFADQVSVQRSSISHLLSGRNNPSLDFVIKVLENFPELDFDWFVKGKGQPFISEDEKSSFKSTTTTPTLFDQELDTKNKEITIPKVKPTDERPPIISEIDKKIKPIDKILVLYKDGSFDSYI
jgi:transcriptional regulator with XRE-family HTH domain